MDGEITPLNKIGEQWRAYFSTGRHDDAKNPLTSIMPEEKLRDVEKFLVSHSAHSLQPRPAGRSRSLQMAPHVVEIVEAFFSQEPFGGLDGAFGEAATGLGVVTEIDAVVRGF